MNENLSTKIHRTEKKLSELHLRLERLNLSYQEWLNNCGFTALELSSYIDNRDNFSLSAWDLLQTEKQQCDENLTKELNNIRDAKKAMQALSEQARIQQHWLFVR